MKLYDPGTLKTFLAQHGITASKGLGQHFLCSRAAVEAIVDSTDDCQGVCEIGPGPGVLTSLISEKVEKMIALELDERMIEALKSSAPKVDVRQIDALAVDLVSVLNELPEPRAIVSNLPYYITGPLLTKIAEANSAFSVAVLMMQKEVAQRISAKAGNSDRGSLSVYLQSQFEITTIAQVPAADFVPPPKVDSTVLKFVSRPIDLDPTLRQAFFKLVRAGFTQPRKTLANNLMATYRIPRETFTELIEKVGLDEKIRPHDLTIEQWVAVTREFLTSQNEI